MKQLKNMAGTMATKQDVEELKSLMQQKISPMSKGNEAKQETKPQGVNHVLPPPLPSEYMEVAWAIPQSGGKHTPMMIARPLVTDHQVKFEMLYCGVCHSDVHTGTNDWGPCNFPFVGGHELLGRVTEVGNMVTKFKVGDIAAVGCIVDSCLDCANCEIGDENYCMKGMTGTYNAKKRHGRVGGNQATFTAGGYSAGHTVHEDFIVKIPKGMILEKTAPILCAGITMYSPLKHWGAAGDKRMTVGIVGIGGLGTMGIKLARALGNDVMAISSSAHKEGLAKEKGATMFACSRDPTSMKSQAGKCDLILNTVSAKHDINMYIPLLKKGGSTIVQLGGVTHPHSFQQFQIMMGRHSIAGSVIGGIRETQEVVDLCYKHHIYPDCEVVEAKDIDECWRKLMETNADGIRYVLDIKKSLKNGSFMPK